MKLTIPNQLTLLRIILTPVFFFYILKENTVSQLLASSIYVIASLTDWYDGWYARNFGVISRWGQFMDPLADKLLVSSALIAFAFIDYVMWWMVWIIIFRDLMVTIVRVYALQKGTPIVTSAIAKWKTFAQMVVIAMILVYINWLNIIGAGSLSYTAAYDDVIGISMLAVTVMTIISAIFYLQENYKLIWRMLKSVIALFSR